MKKVVIILFVLILSFQLISAVDVTILNTNEIFSSGETLIAKVSGNFISPITKSNVFFYQGEILDNNFQVSLDYDVIKINDAFYIYAVLLDKTEGSYSITIENARYKKGAEISEEKIVKNFSIDSQTADFYVNPGVIATSEDFFIEVQNLNENDITINVNTGTNISGEKEIFVEGAKTYSLPVLSGDVEKINFQIGAGESGLRTIEIKTANLVYEVPVYVYTSSSGGATESVSLSFEPSELNFSIPVNSTTKKTVYIYNLGETNLTNISLYFSEPLSDSAILSKSLIETLNAHSYTFVGLSFLSPSESNVEGELNAQVGNTITSAPVYLQFLVNYVASNETLYYSSTKTCAELNGTLYNTQTEKCDKEPIKAKDNWCCLGAVEKIKSSNMGIIIAVIIIAVILLGGLWFYFTKYKKTKRPVNLIEIANKAQPVFSTPARPVQNIQAPIRITPTQQPPVMSRPIIRIIERPVIREVEKIVEKPVIKHVEKKIFVERPKEHIPKYTGSSNTGLYHLSSCKFSKLIEKKYKVQKESAEYFRKNKYQPCKMCIRKK